MLSRLLLMCLLVAAVFGTGVGHGAKTMQHHVKAAHGAGGREAATRIAQSCLDNFSFIVTEPGGDERLMLCMEVEGFMISPHGQPYKKDQSEEF